jgi:hypothetical protein
LNKEDVTPKRKHAVSVYYPFALVEVLEVEPGDEHEETGEMRLSLLDSDGCRVTLRLTKEAFDELKAKLSAP